MSGGWEVTAYTCHANAREMANSGPRGRKLKPYEHATTYVIREQIGKHKSIIDRRHCRPNTVGG